jgi:hypothetical protein
VFAASGDEPCGGGAVFDRLRRLATREGRSLLFRLVRRGESSYFPLGLLFNLREDGRRVFAHPLSIVQPAPVESVDDQGCISAWTFILPPLLKGVPAIQLPPDALPGGDRLTDLEQLRQFMARGIGREPVGFVLLSHHRDGHLSFDDENRSWMWTELDREFPRGSVALLSACSLADATRPLALLQALNRNGVETMILSPYDVPADYGVALAVEFSRQVVKSRRDGATPTVAELFAAASTQTATTLAKTIGERAMGMASEFVLAGDGGRRLCAAAPANP